MPELDLHKKQIKPLQVFELRLPHQLLDTVSYQQHGIKIRDEKINIQYELISSIQGFEQTPKQILTKTPQGCQSFQHNQKK